MSKASSKNLAALSGSGTMSAMWRSLAMMGVLLVIGWRTIARNRGSPQVAAPAIVRTKAEDVFSMYQDLREFIGQVDKLGALRRIEGADANFEIGGITEVAAGRPDGPAL